MLIADLHEFIELYRGNEDARVGVEFLKLKEDINYATFATDMANQVYRNSFGVKTMREIGLPDLPARFDLQLLHSSLIRIKKKETGGIVSFMPGYGKALVKVVQDVIPENLYSRLTPRSDQTYWYSRKVNTPIVYCDPGDYIPITNMNSINQGMAKDID